MDSVDGSWLFTVAQKYNFSGTEIDARAALVFYIVDFQSQPPFTTLIVPGAENKNRRSTRAKWRYFLVSNSLRSGPGDVHEDCQHLQMSR